MYDGILRPTLWMHKVSGGEELLTLLADSYYNKGEWDSDETKDVFALISVLICVGSGLVCVHANADMDGLLRENVRGSMKRRSICADMTELTEQVDQTSSARDADAGVFSASG